MNTTIESTVIRRRPTMMRLETEQVGRWLEVVEKSNRKARKLGQPETIVHKLGTFLAPSDIWSASLPSGVRVDPADIPNSEWTSFVVAAPVITLDGGWSPVAHVSFTTDSDAVITGDSSVVDLDPHRCDRCHKSIRRTSAWVVRHTDGRTEQTGGDCLADYLGHRPVAMWGWVQSALSIGHAPQTDPNLLSTFAFTALACQSVAETGFRKAAEPNSTRLTCERAYRDGGVKVSEESTNAAAAALEWAQDLPSDGNDYLANLRAVARSASVNPKHLGILASLPSAHQRAVAAAKVKEERAETGTDAPTGRLTVTGEILKVDEKWNDFGSRMVMTVLVTDDNGTWRAWGSVPKSCGQAERGDKITFTGTFEQSGQDAGFAFFKRPSKAALIAASDKAA